MRLLAEVRARSAFSAWLAGDDEEYHRQIAALERMIAGSAQSGFGFFLSAARGRVNEREPSAADAPEWVARGFLIACQHADGAYASAEYATRAVEAADASGLPFVQILTRVALAEFALRVRAQLYAEAASFAKRLGSAALLHALEAVEKHFCDDNMLAAFTARLRK